MKLPLAVIFASSATAALETPFHKVWARTCKSFTLSIVDDGYHDGALGMSKRLATDAASGHDADLWAIGFVNRLSDFEGQTLPRTLWLNLVARGAAIPPRHKAQGKIGDSELALHNAGRQSAKDFPVHASLARQWWFDVVGACLCGFRIVLSAMSGKADCRRTSRVRSADSIARHGRGTPDWVQSVARAGSRLGRSPARRLLCGRRGREGGPEQISPFLSLDADDFTRPRPLVLGWLASRLQTREKAFAALAARPSAKRVRA